MVLAGKTEAVSTSEIIEDLTEANADVETMAGLLEELEAALEGKSVPGGGTNLETCTVTITSEVGWLRDYGATIYINGEFDGSYVKENTTYNVTIENVVCGSILYAVMSGTPVLFAATTNGAKLLGNHGAVGFFKITSQAGGTATITIYDAD